jgi:dolichyl-phosphate beta-glucosyltransferase
MPDISIVIPTYNEEKRITLTLDKIITHMDRSQLDYEIVVVDDGSKDDTCKFVQLYINRYPDRIMLHTIKNNSGKGFAVTQGMLIAGGENILYTDADLSTPIEEINRFLNEIDKGFGLVIASRAHRESEIIRHQPFYREIMGKIYNLIVRTVLEIPFRDTQCGFKLFRKDTAKEIFSKILTRRFSFDTEVVLIAMKINSRISELPAPWINSPKSSVRIIRDSLEMLKQILILRRIYVKNIQQ